MERKSLRLIFAHECASTQIYRSPDHSILITFRVLSQPFVHLFFGRLALQFFTQALAHVLLLVTRRIVQTSITVIRA
jgi:hypothetical protein